MKLAVVCLVLAGLAMGQKPGAIPEPSAYGQLNYWDEAAGVLKAVPYETVTVRGKRGEQVAEFAGARAALRFVEGQVPALVIAYASLPPGGWVAQMYLLEPKSGARQAPLGVWATAKAKEQTAGAVPVRLEKHGKLSYQVKPPVLRPGEYVVRSSTGRGGFTFGVDGK